MKTQVMAAADWLVLALFAAVLLFEIILALGMFYLLLTPVK